jgi:hypothetical protein
MVKRNIEIYNLKNNAPQLCLEWNYNKNTVAPELFHKSSYEKVWWICNKNHEWITSIHARVFGKTGCPYCANKLACEDNCLLIINPNLCLEWNYAKNILSPKEVLPNSKLKVWWICSHGHEWKAWISDRVNGTKCTQCAYNYVIRDSSDIYSEDGNYKKCRSCNKFLSFSEFRIKGNNKKGYYENNICKDCDVKQVRDYRLTDKGIAAEIVRRIKYISKKESIPFDLTKEWVLNRLIKINWCCELTGLPFNLVRDNLEIKKKGFKWDSLSIDKIIPSLGYIQSNVRFILNQINVFKQDGSDERMYNLAEILLRNKK